MKAPFHSALFSNQKQRCAEISKPETDLMWSNDSCPSLEQPHPTPILCSSVPKPWLCCFHKTCIPLPKVLPLCTEGRNLDFQHTPRAGRAEGVQSSCRGSSTQMNMIFNTGQFHLTLHYKLHLREKPEPKYPFSKRRQIMQNWYQLPPSLSPCCTDVYLRKGDADPKTCHFLMWLQNCLKHS